MKNMPPWLWIVFAVVYWVSPIDIVPDLFMGIGWLDDLVFAYFSYQKFCEGRLQANGSGAQRPTKIRQLDKFDVAGGVVIDAEIIEERPRVRQWS